MPVYLSTKAFELLQLKQTSEQSYKFTRQRGNELHNILAGELQLQYGIQEQKKRELSTSFFPVIPQKSKYAENLRKRIHFKTIKNRIPSATRTPSGREVTLCDRDKAMEDSQMGRHFCELLGPRFCVDCTKAKERDDALRDCEEHPTSFHLERDPFTAFVVCNNLSKGHDCEDSDSDEEIFDKELLDQDELSDLEELTSTAEKRFYNRAVSNVVFTPSPPGKGGSRYPSPPGRGDSGYSSRVSHIRELTRAQSCSILRKSPRTFSPLRREKTHAPTIKEKLADSRQSSGFGSPTRGTLSREYSSESSTFIDTIKKLQKRSESNRYQLDGSKSWLKGPVEPILMELKLINFTQYDKLGYEPPPIEPEPCNEGPAFTVDEFGFPIMDSLPVSFS